MVCSLSGWYSCKCVKNVCLSQCGGFGGGGILLYFGLESLV